MRCERREVELAVRIISSTYSKRYAVAVDE
jgi:hypothetical protein